MVRPKSQDWSLEALWALCNSPIANAYSYAFSGKRDVLAGLMRAMPVPKVRGNGLSQLNKLVKKYFKLVKQTHNTSVEDALAEKLKTLQWRIDAEVLRLYDLPINFERQLLDLFAGARRRGVEYVQKSFPHPVALHDLLAITKDWSHTNEQRSHLILKEERRGLTAEEKIILRNLQRLADLRIELVAPLPISQLEAITRDLRKRGIPVPVGDSPSNMMPWGERQHTFMILLIAGRSLRIPYRNEGCVHP
jgi:hypothetical protein